MSRFAQATARAGCKVPEQDETGVWDSQGRVATDLVADTVVYRRPAQEKEPAPAVRRPAPAEKLRSSAVEPEARPNVVAPEARLRDVPESVRRDLAPLIELVFLASAPSPVKSLLFCCAAGEPTGDVALRAAELLAADTGRRIAVVEDGSVARRTTNSGRNDLVTRIGWYPPEPTRTSASTGSESPSTVDAPVADRDVLGEHVSDLFAAFDYVIVSASAAHPDDLVPIAREVDGVVLLVTERKTMRQSASSLADSLRAAGAKLLGVVLIS